MFLVLLLSAVTPTPFLTHTSWRYFGVSSCPSVMYFHFVSTTTVTAVVWYARMLCCAVSFAISARPPWMQRTSTVTLSSSGLRPPIPPHKVSWFFFFLLGTQQIHLVHMIFLPLSRGQNFYGAPYPEPERIGNRPEPFRISSRPFVRFRKFPEPVLVADLPFETFSGTFADPY